jgi:hypothetical protein
MSYDTSDYSRFKLFRMGLGFGIYFIPNFSMNFYPFPLYWWSVARWSHAWSKGKTRHNLKLGPFWFAVDRRTR